MSKGRKDAEHYINKFNKLVKVGTVVTSGENYANTKGITSITVEEGDNWTQMYSEDSEYRKLLPYPYFVSDKKDEIISVYNNVPVLLKLYTDDNGDKNYQFTLLNKERRKLKLYNIQANVFGNYCYGKAKDLLDTKGIYAYERKKRKKLGVNTHHMNADDRSLYETETVTNKAHTVIDSYKTKNKNDIAAIDNFIQTKLFPLAAEEAPDKFTIFICERGDTQEGRLFNYQGLFESNKIVLTKKAVKEIKLALKSAIIEYNIHHIIDKYVTYMMVKDPDFFYAKRYVLIGDRPNNNAYTFSIKIDGKKKAKKKIRFNIMLMDIRKCTLDDGTISIHNMIDTDYFDGKTVAFCQHDLNYGVLHQDLLIKRRKNGAA